MCGYDPEAELMSDRRDFRAEMTAAKLEIARLQAEVERLHKLNLSLSMERHVPAIRIAAKMHESQAQASDDYMALVEQCNAAWNDALEAAACELDMWGDIYGDNAAAAIRALKRT